MSRVTSSATANVTPPQATPAAPVLTATNTNIARAPATTAKVISTPSDSLANSKTTTDYTRATPLPVTASITDTDSKAASAVTSPIHSSSSHSPSFVGPLVGAIVAFLAVSFVVVFAIFYSKRRRENARKIREGQKAVSLTAEMLKREKEGESMDGNIRSIIEEIWTSPSADHASLIHSNKRDSKTVKLLSHIPNGDLISPSASSHFSHGPQTCSTNQWATESLEMRIAQSGYDYSIRAGQVAPAYQAQDYFNHFPPPDSPLPPPPVTQSLNLESNDDFHNFPDQRNEFSLPDDSHMPDNSSHSHNESLFENSWPQTPSVHSPLAEISPVLYATRRSAGLPYLVPAAPVASVRAYSAEGENEGGTADETSDEEATPCTSQSSLQQPTTLSPTRAKLLQPFLSPQPPSLALPNFENFQPPPLPPNQGLRDLTLPSSNFTADAVESDDLNDSNVKQT